MLEQAYSQRQDLHAQKLAIEVQQGRKNQILARYFPQLNAQFQYPRLDPETFADQDEYWTLLVNLRWSIFDGGNREIDLQEANENLSQAKLRVGELEKKIWVEVREALLLVEGNRIVDFGGDVPALQELPQVIALLRPNHILVVDVSV